MKYEHHWADFSGAATDDQQTASVGLTTRAAEDTLLLTLETAYAKGPEAEEFTATGNFWIKF